MLMMHSKKTAEVKKPQDLIKESRPRGGVGGREARDIAGRSTPNCPAARGETSTPDSPLLAGSPGNMGDISF